MFIYRMIASSFMHVHTIVLSEVVLRKKITDILSYPRAINKEFLIEHGVIYINEKNVV